MRVIAVATLKAFWQRHPAAKQPLEAWFEEASVAAWTQPSDLRVPYRSASVLKNRRVVFNIKGSEYRRVVAVAYRLQISSTSSSSARTGSTTRSYAHVIEPS